MNEIELTGNESRLCFASAQTSQALFNKKRKFNRFFAIKPDLEEDKCPN